MKIETRWVHGKCFVSTVEQGHAVITDAPTQFGGTDSAQTPMELMLSAAASCASIDVTSIMAKQRQPLDSCRVVVSAEQAPTPPKVFTKLHFEFAMSGSDLTDKAIEKAIEMTFETHCSVSIMIARSGAELSWEYKVL